MNFVTQSCRAMVSVSKRVWRSISKRRRTRRRRRRRTRRWRMTRRSGESLKSAGALCRVPAPSRLSQRSKKGLRSADCWWNNSPTFTRSLRSPKTLVAKLCSPTKEGNWSEPVLNNLRNLCNGERALTFESHTWGRSSRGGNVCSCIWTGTKQVWRVYLVFGNVYLANRSMCVFWARSWYLWVCIRILCEKHLHLQLGCNEEGCGNKTRGILLTWIFQGEVLVFIQVIKNLQPGIWKTNVFSLFRGAGGIVQGYGQKQSFQDTRAFFRPSPSLLLHITTRRELVKNSFHFWL